MSGYGAMEGGLPIGLQPQPVKNTFLRGQRRRMNLIAIILSVIIPWAIFTFVYAMRCFSIRYTQPALAWFFVIMALLVVVVACIAAASHRARFFQHIEHEPSWLVFVAITMVVAWVLGQTMGDLNFQQNMQAYYDLLNLNTYPEVSTAQMRGQQMMDAGLVTFVPGTSLDLSYAMGFRNLNTYCVAPIVSPLNGSTTMVTYDFWAVGTDCCTGGMNDFQCGAFNDPNANAGIRLMSDKDRPFYRLAVQQAEATYGITAAHPLFFQWVSEPNANPLAGGFSLTSQMMLQGRRQFILWTLSFLFVQAFVVVVASLVFSKLGTEF